VRYPVDAAVLDLGAVAPGASHSGGFRHLDEILLGVGVDLAWERCNLFNQGAWDREPLLAGILDGYVRDELRRVADNGVKNSRSQSNRAPMKCGHRRAIHVHGDGRI